MKTQALLLSAIVLVMAFVLTPREGDGSEAIPVQVAQAPATTPANVSPFYSAGGETILPREGDGHFYADVMVQGAPVRMLVDTGASFIALTRDDADALGLAWYEEDSIVVGQGASGDVYGVPLHLSEVELGGHIVRNVQAAVITDGLHVSLLGQSFLGRIETMRIEQDRMVLSGS